MSRKKWGPVGAACDSRNFTPSLARLLLLPRLVIQEEGLVLSSKMQEALGPVPLHSHPRLGQLFSDCGGGGGGVEGEPHSLWEGPTGLSAH